METTPENECTTPRELCPGVSGVNFPLLPHPNQAIFQSLGCSLGWPECCQLSLSEIKSDLAIGIILNSLN